MVLIGKALMLVFLMFAAAACGNADGSCDDIVCLEGTSCLLEDGTPTCVPDGTEGGSGGNGEGEGCESTSDCATGLACTPGVNGVLTCQ
jgi:hypothetical protein